MAISEKLRGSWYPENKKTWNVIIVKSAMINIFTIKLNGVLDIIKNKVVKGVNFKNIKEYNSAIGDIYRFKKAFPEVQFRYYVEPSVALPSGVGMLNFDNSTSTYAMQM